MRKWTTFLLFVTMVLATLPIVAQSVDFPAWTPGTLDIHQISTGRGNAALFIFPDGTTMLFDAGAAGDGEKIPDMDPRPNDSRRAGDWIARYVEHMLAPGPARLDYAVLTHFHPDHMGHVTPSSPTSSNGAYKLSGITEVGDRIPIATMIDRGYPSYDFPAPLGTDPTVKNYLAFTAEQSKKSMKVERLAVGRNDQITLRREPGRYPSFAVRNVAANGDVWTGTGTATTHIFPELSKLAAEDQPSENMCSIGIRISYGKFDYFTGGDMPGIPDAGAPDWQSVETAVEKAIGPTDVHVVNHHGSIDPESPFFLSTLRSRVIVLPAWSPTHPSQDALKRILSLRLYPGPRDVFATLVREPTKASIGERAARFKADHGHIVIRVAPGGDSYRVYVLDDTTESYKVLATFGPYQSQ